MDWQGWLTLIVLALMVIALTSEWAAPDVVLMGGLCSMAATRILTPTETFAGFANESVATIGALLVMAAALRNTGALEAIFGRIFGRAKSELSALIRMLLPVAGASAFLNNTTLVAIMTPSVIDWAHRNRRSPSRYLIPLDFATILGGVTTMIGTSTNLTVAALLEKSGMAPMRLFELTPVGLPICLVGLVYLLLARRLLPERQDPTHELGERRREYTVTMMVEPRSSLAGRTIEEAGLRHLPGLFLVEIDRDGHLITPVAPDDLLSAGDRLVFAGVVSSIVDLQRIRGLVAVNDQAERGALPHGRRLAEAVISHSSPLVNLSIKEANFRTVYDAAVIAVHRNGERVGGKIGEIVMRPGDTLLLQTSPGFLRAHSDSADFYLISEVADAEPPRFDRAWVALGVLLAMVAVVSTGLLPISVAAFLAVAVLVGTRCIKATAARRSVDWSMPILIAAAIGFGTAMEKTGAAAAIANGLAFGPARAHPFVALAVTYFVTMVLTEVISNNAAAALMFPIGVALAKQCGADPRGFVMAVSIAASCGFAMPFGYQTHLIVYGPGGYRLGDFLRVGLPLDLLCGTVAVILIPWIWPLSLP